MKFNFKEAIKAIDGVATPVISESSTSGYGTPERLSMWNMTRSHLAPVMAIIPLDKPQGYVFGKARQIEGKSALEFSRDGEYFERLVLDKSYVKDDIFQFSSGVYDVVEEFTIAADTSDFEVANIIESMLASGAIVHHMVESTFSLEKLMVTAASTYTRCAITQELMQDIESSYGIDLMRDALVASASERMNKEMVRFMLETAKADAPFAMKNDGDYKDARSLARAIQDSASNIQIDTGNEATWVMMSPKVYSILSTSGLIDDGFLGDLEVLKDMYFAPKDKEYFLVGFVHEADDSDHAGDQFEKFQVGSYVLAPYVQEFHRVLATESMAEVQGSQLRFAISVAPYGGMDKKVAGDNALQHAGKNTNARLVEVTL